MLQFTDMEVVGLIPTFLSEHDPRSAAEQIDENYQHGGGWRHFEGFELIGEKGDKYSIVYAGDPPMYELSRATLRDETLVFFQTSWMAIIQKDGSFEISRID